MKETKRRLEVFSFYDHTGMTRHLEKMAAKGWMLEKVSGMGWVYRKIEPKKIRFTISYFPKASEFDPEMPESQLEFQDFCRHTGWEPVACSGQLQIFCNDREDPIPIETDPVLEVETIHKTAKKSFLMSYFILLAVSVLDLVLGAASLFDKPLDLLASVVNLFSLFAWGILLILCVTELTGYFLWLTRARKAAQEGIFLETKGTSGLQKVILAVMLAGFAYWLANILTTAPRMLLMATLLMILVQASVFFLVFGIKKYLKKKKVKAKWNLLVTFGLSFVIAFALVLGGTHALIRANGAGLFDRNRETYQFRGSSFSIYRDELPLTVEDLVEVPYSDEYTRQKTGSESPLLARFTSEQRPRMDAAHFSEMPHISYTVTEVKAPFLYGFCRTQLLAERKDEVYDGGVVLNHYVSVDPAPWGAREAYRVYWDDGFLNKYLLCYDRTLVELTLDWAPTEEQMAIVGEKLGQ